MMKLPQGVKLASVLVLGLAMCTTASAAKARKAAPKRPAAAAAEQPTAAVSSDIEVDLAHQLGEEKDEQLKKLVERFNAQSKDGHIVVSERAWAQGAQPAMTIVSEQDEDLFLDGKSRFKPVWQVMKESGVPLDTFSPPKVMVPASIDSANHPVALPVALSTPVLFYNKDLLDKVGVDAGAIPRSWKAWVDVMGRFYTAGVGCPMTVSHPVSSLIENVSAWNNQPLTTGGKNEQIAVNGLVQVKHMAMMASWAKAGYLYYFGRGNEADAHFTSGECGLIVAPSGSYPDFVKDAKFTVGVAPYPYHDDAFGAPVHTLADGPALWVASGKSKAEYKLIARFLQFWLQPDNQVQWQVGAGYLPLNRAGMLAATNSIILRDQMAATRQAIAQLTNRPATPTTAASALTHRLGVRRILAEEMEQVFQDHKPAKQGLDDAEMRIRSTEDGCCRASLR